MPSFADSAVIFVLALMLFGPKKLPQLARQLGKLMAEFRRASNEFRMQMEDELRIEDQKEHQKKVDAMAGPPSDLPDPEHPHLPSSTDETADDMSSRTHGALGDGSDAVAEISSEPPVNVAAPIAESGDLRMMPPSTGLPVESRGYGASSESDVFEYHDVNSVDAANVSVETNGHSAIPEHTILPPAPPVGMSSEEPAAETSQTEEQTHA